MLIGLLRHGEVDGGNRLPSNTDEPLTGIALVQRAATHGGVIRVLRCHSPCFSVAQLKEFEVEHGQLNRVRIGSDGLAELAREIADFRTGVLS